MRLDETCLQVAAVSDHVCMKRADHDDPHEFIPWCEALGRVRLVPYDQP